MLKRKIDSYLQHYYATTRNALLVTGARQTGKTFSIREFGRSFKSFVEINFVDRPEAVNVFKGAKSSSDILLRLSALTSVPLIKGETLIFFDEVQKCPEIVTAIKFLVDEGSYRYILSGSLLGVELKDLRSEPVGYMGVKDMFPLDFEEFVSCAGVGDNVIETLRDSWRDRMPVDRFVHSKMMELFRLYLVVGGMPAAVSKYLETNNLQDVMAVQRDIIRLYKRDIAQYDPENKLYIEEIFNLIPPELNAKNKRFILKRLNENAKFERFRNSECFRCPGESDMMRKLLPFIFLMTCLLASCNLDLMVGSAPELGNDYNPPKEVVFSGQAPSRPMATKSYYEDRIVVSWSAVAGADYYSLERAEFSVTPTQADVARAAWTPIYDYPSALRYEDDDADLRPGYYYAYRVTAHTYVCSQGRRPRCAMALYCPLRTSSRRPRASIPPGSL